ncbi:MAG: hypothetical protein BWY38_02677 [Ignavibacteria bacterium ADurb.Bin266]|nr:MAG: hypothetical protein BWY38_02677 [Ignavibacteria bacterium ADurb.Bin266]
MEYNINFKYKSGGGTASSGMGAVTSARQRAIQASQRSAQVGTVKPDENSRKLVDSNIKLTTSILKLNQSVTMLTAVMKNRPVGAGGGGAGGGGVVGPQGNTGLGSVGAALGYIGVPVALAGFAVQKINQIGNAYIEKVSQQKGTVGVGDFRTERVGAYLGPEVSQAYKAHRMAGGRFKGDIDPLALKMGTIYGLGAEEVGRQSGQIARFGKSYGDIAGVGVSAGIETELPRFLQAIAGELEDAVKKGVNASDMTSDIGEEVARLTANTRTQSVEMALSIIGKTKSTKESAARGQISGVESLMTWKAGETKLLEQLQGKDRGSLISKLEEQGLIDKGEAERLRTGDVSKGGTINAQYIRSVIGQGGYSSLVRDVISGMSGGESARRSMLEVQKIWGTGIQGFRQWNAMYPSMGGNLEQNELLAMWKTAQDQKKFDKIMGKSKIQEQFEAVEKTDPMLGVKKAQMMDNLLYKYGSSFASASLKMEKALLDLADTIAKTAIPIIQNAAGGKFGKASKKELEAVKKTMKETPMWTWGDDSSLGL